MPQSFTPSQIAPSANATAVPVLYVPPPTVEHNAFAAFWAGFLQARTPWATELFRRRLDAMDPSRRAEAALRARQQDLEAMKTLAQLERVGVESNDRRMRILADLTIAEMRNETERAGLGVRAQEANLDAAVQQGKRVDVQTSAGRRIRDDARRRIETGARLLAEGDIAQGRAALQGAAGQLQQELATVPDATERDAIENEIARALESASTALGAGADTFLEFSRQLFGVGESTPTPELPPVEVPSTSGRGVFGGAVGERLEGMLDQPQGSVSATRETRQTVPQVAPGGPTGRMDPDFPAERRQPDNPAGDPDLPSPPEQPDRLGPRAPDLPPGVLEPDAEPADPRDALLGPSPVASGAASPPQPFSSISSESIVEGFEDPAIGKIGEPIVTRETRADRRAREIVGALGPEGAADLGVAAERGAGRRDDRIDARASRRTDRGERANASDRKLRLLGPGRKTREAARFRSDVTEDREARTERKVENDADTKGRPLVPRGKTFESKPEGAELPDLDEILPEEKKESEEERRAKLLGRRKQREEERHARALS